MILYTGSTKTVLVTQRAAQHSHKVPVEGGSCLYPLVRHGAAIARGGVTDWFKAIAGRVRGPSTARLYGQWARLAGVGMDQPALRLDQHAAGGDLYTAAHLSRSLGRGKDCRLNLYRPKLCVGED